MPHPLQRYLFVDFLMMGILTSVRSFDFHFSNNQWCWASFHLYEKIYALLAICMSSLDKYLLDLPLIIWLSCLVFCYWATWAVCIDIFWRIIPCGLLCSQYFLPFCGLSFHFVYGLLLFFFFFFEKIFIRSHLFIFVFIFTTLGHGSKRSCCSLCQRVFCLCFPQRVL